MPLTTPPKAVLFDIFGTTCNWQETVPNYLHTTCKITLNSATHSLASKVRVRATDLTLQDWQRFTQQWRNSYLDFVRRVANRTGPDTEAASHYTATQTTSKDEATQTTLSDSKEVASQDAALPDASQKDAQDATSQDAATQATSQDKATQIYRADFASLDATLAATQEAMQVARDYLLNRSKDDPQPPKPYVTVDAFHISSLHNLLSAWNLTGLWNSKEVHDLSILWHYLAPYPDSRPGLASLHASGYTTATLSNGNAKLIADLVEHGGLKFTTILSADMWQRHKPDERVYMGAVERLGVQAGECVMVAAHLGDLQVARGCGLKTCYVERAGEEVWSSEEVRKAKREGWVDEWVGIAGAESGDNVDEGFEELARRLENLKVLVRFGGKVDVGVGDPKSTKFKSV